MANNMIGKKITDDFELDTTVAQGSLIGSKITDDFELSEEPSKRYELDTVKFNNDLNEATFVKGDSDSEASAKNFMTLYLANKSGSDPANDQYEAMSEVYYGKEVDPIELASTVQRLNENYNFDDSKYAKFKNGTPEVRKEMIDAHLNSNYRNIPGQKAGRGITNIPGKTLEESYEEQLKQTDPKRMIKRFGAKMTEQGKDFAMESLMQRDFNLTKFKRLNRKDQMLMEGYMMGLNPEIKTDWTPEALERLKMGGKRAVGAFVATGEEIARQYSGPKQPENMYHLLNRRFGKDVKNLFDADTGLIKPRYIVDVRKAIEREEILLQSKQKMFADPRGAIAFALPEIDYMEQVGEIYNQGKEIYTDTKTQRQYERVIQRKVKEKGFVFDNSLGAIEMGVDLLGAMGSGVATSAVGLGPSGAVAYSYARFQGEFTKDLIYDHGVDPDEAFAISNVASIPYVAIEIMQVDQLSKLLGVGKKTVREGIKKSIIEILSSGIKNYASEVTEESAQAAVQSGAKLWAKKYADAEGITWSGELENWKTETAEAAKTMIFISGPGSMVGAAKAALGGPKDVDTAEQKLNTIKNEPVTEDELVLKEGEGIDLTQTDLDKVSDDRFYDIFDEVNEKIDTAMEKQLLGTDDLRRTKAIESVFSPSSKVDFKNILDWAGVDVDNMTNEDAKTVLYDQFKTRLEKEYKSNVLAKEFQSEIELIKEKPVTVNTIEDVVFENNMQKHVKVVKTYDEVPNYIKTKLNVSGLIPAVYDPEFDEVYLIADHIPKRSDIPKIITEEVIGHKGFLEALGHDNVKQFVQDIRANEEFLPYLESIAKQRNLNLNYYPDMTTAVLEMVADKAVKREMKPSMLRDVYAGIRNLVRKVFKLEYNDVDIDRMLDRASNKYKMDEKISKGVLRKHNIEELHGYNKVIGEMIDVARKANIKNVDLLAKVNEDISNEIDRKDKELIAEPETIKMEMVDDLADIDDADFYKEREALKKQLFTPMPSDTIDLKAEVEALKPEEVAEEVVEEPVVDEEDVEIAKLKAEIESLRKEVDEDVDATDIMDEPREENFDSVEEYDEQMDEYFKQIDESNKLDDERNAEIEKAIVDKKNRIDITERLKADRLEAEKPKKELKSVEIEHIPTGKLGSLINETILKGVPVEDRIDKYDLDEIELRIINEIDEMIKKHNERYGDSTGNNHFYAAISNSVVYRNYMLKTIDALLKVHEDDERLAPLRKNVNKKIRTIKSDLKEIQKRGDYSFFKKIKKLREEFDPIKDEYVKIYEKEEMFTPMPSETIKLKAKAKEITPTETVSMINDWVEENVDEELQDNISELLNDINNLEDTVEQKIEPKVEPTVDSAKSVDEVMEFVKDLEVEPEVKEEFVKEGVKIERKKPVATFEKGENAEETFENMMAAIDDMLVKKGLEVNPKESVAYVEAAKEDIRKREEQAKKTGGLSEEEKAALIEQHKPSKLTIGEYIQETGMKLSEEAGRMGTPGIEKAFRELGRTIDDKIDREYLEKRIEFMRGLQAHSDFIRDPERNAAFNVAVALSKNKPASQLKKKYDKKAFNRGLDLYQKAVLKENKYNPSVEGIKEVELIDNYTERFESLWTESGLNLEKMKALLGKQKILFEKTALKNIAKRDTVRKVVNTIQKATGLDKDGVDAVVKDLAQDIMGKRSTADSRAEFANTVAEIANTIIKKTYNTAVLDRMKKNEELLEIENRKELEKEAAKKLNDVVADNQALSEITEEEMDNERDIIAEMDIIETEIGLYEANLKYNKAMVTKSHISSNKKAEMKKTIDAIEEKVRDRKAKLKELNKKRKQNDEKERIDRVDIPKVTDEYHSKPRAQRLKSMFEGLLTARHGHMFKGQTYDERAKELKGSAAAKKFAEKYQECIGEYRELAKDEVTEKKKYLNNYVPKDPKDEIDTILKVDALYKFGGFDLLEEGSVEKNRLENEMKNFDSFNVILEYDASKKLVGDLSNDLADAKEFRRMKGKVKSGLEQFHFSHANIDGRLKRMFKHATPEVKGFISNIAKSISLYSDIKQIALKNDSVEMMTEIMETLRADDKKHTKALREMNTVTEKHSEFSQDGNQLNSGNIMHILLGIDYLKDNGIKVTNAKLQKRVNKREEMWKSLTSGEQNLYNNLKKMWTGKINDETSLATSELMPSFGAEKRSIPKNRALLGKNPPFVEGKIISGDLDINENISFIPLYSMRVDELRHWQNFHKDGRSNVIKTLYRKDIVDSMTKTHGEEMTDIMYAKLNDTLAGKYLNELWTNDLFDSARAFLSITALAGNLGSGLRQIAGSPAVLLREDVSPKSLREMWDAYKEAEKGVGLLNDFRITWNDPRIAERAKGGMSEEMRNVMNTADKQNSNKIIDFVVGNFFRFSSKGISLITGGGDMIASFFAAPLYRRAYYRELSALGNDHVSYERNKEYSAYIKSLKSASDIYDESEIKAANSLAIDEISSMDSVQHMINLSIQKAVKEKEGKEVLDALKDAKEKHKNFVDSISNTAEYQAHRNAHSNFMETIESTQQSNQIKDTVDLISKGGSVGKLGITFKTSPLQQLSKEVEYFNRALAVYEKTKGKQKSGFNALLLGSVFWRTKEGARFGKALFLNHVVLPGAQWAAGIAVKGLFGGEYEEDDIWKLFAMGLTGPFSSLLFAGQLYEVSANFILGIDNWYTPTTLPIDSLIRKSEMAFDNIKNLADKPLDALFSMLALLSPAVRDVMKTKENIIGEDFDFDNIVDDASEQYGNLIESFVESIGDMVETVKDIPEKVESKYETFKDKF